MIIICCWGAENKHSGIRSKIMRFNCELKKRNITLDMASDEVINQIAHEVGFECFKKIPVSRE